MLKYCLIKSPMTKDEQHFVAQSTSAKTVYLEEIIKDMVDEGTGLTRPQALAYFEKITELTKKYLEQGYFVSTPLFRFRTSISGKFDNKQDHFDASRHAINITSTPGTRIKDIKSFPIPNKISADETPPNILHFIDSITEERDSTGTSDDLAMIYGKNLKFDKKDIKQGVFFISVENPKNEFRSFKYQIINPGSIVFRTPELAKGPYKVAVRIKTPNSKKLVTDIHSKIITF